MKWIIFNPANGSIRLTVNGEENIVKNLCEPYEQYMQCENHINNWNYAVNPDGTLTYTER